MNKIRQLFELQNFEKNQNLEELIDETRSRYPEAFEMPGEDTAQDNIVSFKQHDKVELSDENLEMLAAGRNKSAGDKLNFIYKRPGEEGFKAP